jgi:hypothetical protein
MATRVLKPNRMIDGRPFYSVFDTGFHTGANRFVDKIITNLRYNGLYVRRIKQYHPKTGRPTGGVEIFVSPMDHIGKKEITIPILVMDGATYNERGRQMDDGLRLIWGEKVKLG